MRPAEAMGVPSSQLQELRAWQAARLASTYGDLLHDPGCVDAVKFFLTDLYGPQEHTRRDQDLARAWSILSRTLPRAALGLLERALELQTLTAELDEAMARQLAAGPVTQESYAAAYRAVGRPEARRRQIDLVLSIATDLERVVRHAWVGFALRAARAPAHAAGFGALQDFLERGFAAFRSMKDPGRMLDAIRERETRLCTALLAGGATPFGP
ncbi:MAG TPA: hypothetical protein VMT09_00940 [Steroidobacteraceae bacterium]|nr:hypothetical protein [Steroidobacteraceae bacterium]